MSKPKSELIADGIPDASSADGDSLDALAPTPEELAAAAAFASTAEPIVFAGRVAVIGRPNVGKSTLFNRLVGKRQAIVHDQPGVTRDRIVGSFELPDRGTVELVDTGGLVPGDDPLGLGDQVMLAIEESDVLLFIVDGKEGSTAADQAVWEAVRPLSKSTILIVNKGDTKVAQEGWGEFYAYGLDTVVLVSAEHGLGIVDLHDALRANLPEPAAEDPDDAALPSLAVVGRPNVGKSSLINSLLGATRVLVSPVAGTTRDPIDSIISHGDARYRMIDTAGIRRRSQVTGAAEDLAVMFARRQIERADVVILLIDASSGLTSGDLAIAGEAWRLGKGVVVACNKWDLVGTEAREALDEDWPRIGQLTADAPRVNLSALTKWHIDRLMPAVGLVLERTKKRISTGETNRLFERAIRAHQPPQKKGRPWKLFYGTQVATGPPTFMLFANRTLDRSDTYRRYLENRMRESLDLAGVPVRLVIRKR